MDKKTIFVKTDNGESEVSGQSDALYGDVKRILHLVDDESTVAEITKRAPPSLRDTLQDVLQELVDGGYIRDMRAPKNEPPKSTLKITTPAFKMATPKIGLPTKEATSTTNQSTPLLNKGSDLDFSFITAGATPAKNDQGDEPFDLASTSKLDPATKAARLKTYDAAKERAKLEAAARARTEAPTFPGKASVTDKAQQEAEANKAREQAEADLARKQAEARQALELAEANKAREQAEAIKAAQAWQEAERLKAEQAAQLEAAAKAAKLKAYEAAKEKARIEVAARARIEAEINQKKEAEAARLKIEQETLKARIESETRIKQEVEASRLRAEKEAERLRLELEAAKAKAEIEHRNRIEAEARAKVEAEARIKREAEAERLRFEKERAEMEVARVKAETEIKLRAESELRVRAEVEARLKAEALEKQAELRSLQHEAMNEAAGAATHFKEEQVDQAEKLRQSFVESFGQIKAKQDAHSNEFKLDKFSLLDTGKMPAFTGQPVKPAVLPGGGVRVKEVLEQRAQKEAEAQRLKSEQEAARLKEKQDEAARIRAEQDSNRLKAEHEAYLLQVQQDEERAKAEAEERKLTEQQSKQWEEGQRRATLQAQAEKDRLAAQAAKSQVKTKQKSVRRIRQPFPTGKILGGVFVLGLLAIVGLPYIWPMGDYIPPLENEISAQIHQPVHIKNIDFALLPLPRLELHSLALGKGEEIKVGDVVMNFDFSALFAPVKSISKLELHNVMFEGATFDKSLLWLRAAGEIEKYPVAHMELKNVHVNNDQIKLPALNGLVDFDPQGKFTHAMLTNEDQKLSLELQPQQNSLQLDLNMHEGSLPILSNIKFSDLSANGVVDNGQINISDFFAHIHGGTLTGKGQLNWMNGWKLQGQINVKSLDLRRMFPDVILSGDLSGDISVSMNSLILSQLDQDPHVDGTFLANNGVISKLDIETVARFGERPGVAGHTNYNEMTGTLKVDSQGQHITLSKLELPGSNVTGVVNVDAKQQLSGKLLVDIKEQGSVPLHLSGTASEPVLQQGR